jgi:hypothetical protein
MAKRTALSELPKQLAVERYATCERFTLQQWASALLMRFQCKNAIDKDYRDSAEKRLTGILTDPIAGADVRMLAVWLALKPTLRGPTVVNLRWRDAVQIANLLQEEVEPQYLGFDGTEIQMREVARARRNDLRRDPEPEMPFQAAFNTAEASKPSTTRLVVAKLDASDEQLVDDFKAWLAQTRKALGHGGHSPPSVPSFARPVAPFDLQSLHQSRVLTYIDLNLWAEIHGRAISAQVFAEALFGDGSRTNTIRDTVQPKARALMTEDSLRPLIAQAQAGL